MTDNKSEIHRAFMAIQNKIKLTTRADLEHFANEFFARVVSRTPIDTGHAKGSWRKFDGATAMEKIIVNPVHYSVYLEHGTSKTQAPHGMVRVTLKEMQRELRK